MHSAWQVVGAEAGRQEKLNFFLGPEVRVESRVVFAFFATVSTFVQQCIPTLLFGLPLSRSQVLWSHNTKPYYIRPLLSAMLNLAIGLNNLVLLGWYNAVNRPERFVFEDLFDVDWCAYKRRRGNRKLNFAGHHNIFKVDIKGHWWWWKKFLDGLSSLAVMISQNTPSALSLWPNSINSINCFPRSDLNVKRDPLPTITNNLDSSSE